MSARSALYFRDRGNPYWDRSISITQTHQHDIFRILERLHGRHKFGAGDGPRLTIVNKTLKRPGGKIPLDRIMVTMLPISPDECEFKAWN